MAFTMSYGAIPSPALTETIPKVIAPTKPAGRRGRKHETLQTQAQALFEPALDQTRESPARPASMEVAESRAELPVLPEEEAAKQSMNGQSPA